MLQIIAVNPDLSYKELVVMPCSTIGYDMDAAKEIMFREDEDLIKSIGSSCSLLTFELLRELGVIK